MNEESCVPPGTDIKNTGFGYTLSLIGGKYKMTILYALSEQGVMRYGALRRHLGTISFRMLTLMLKELEKDGLVLRKEYPQIPPKVEYSLSERGASLIPILNALCDWGERHGPAAPPDAKDREKTENGPMTEQEPTPISVRI